MELVKKMFRWSIPIIGFPMVREGTGNEELLSYTPFDFWTIHIYRGKFELKKKGVETTAIRMRKDENNFWKIDVGKLVQTS